MKQLLILVIYLFAIHVTVAHGMHDPAKHDPKKKAVAKSDSMASQGQQGKDSTQHHSSHQENAADEAHTSAQHPHTMDEFPTLHPLVVHFPIMFLLIAAIMQLAGFFVFKRELSWIVLVLLILGFIGAYVAGKYVHPHTHGLTERAATILAEHDLYADWTVWLSGLGSVLKIVSHFALKRKLWAEAIVALVLIGAAYAVSMAGHHGAQLVHIEGVGPQGKFLEMHDH
jgi:uncharacterized membrane protein